jgi:hypothetical protein
MEDHKLQENNLNNYKNIQKCKHDFPWTGFHTTTALPSNPPNHKKKTFQKVKTKDPTPLHYLASN